MLLIRQKRLDKDWTLEFVAERLGITNQAVNLIETGQRKPSFDVLVKLEDLFEMDYRDLFNLPRRQLWEQQSDPDGNRGE